MEEKGLGSINKEGLLKNELPKGDLRGAATEVLRVIPSLLEENLSFYCQVPKGLIL